MNKLFKLLGVLAFAISSYSPAFALSITTSPIFATGTSVDFIFSYSSPTSFNLSDLKLFSDPAVNLLGGPLATYTSSTGGPLSGTGSLTEHITATPGVPYTVSYNITGSLPNSINVSLSAVPLPASLPLFTLALISLVAFGYHSRRKRIELSALSDDQVSM